MIAPLPMLSALTLALTLALAQAAPAGPPDAGPIAVRPALPALDEIEKLHAAATAGDTAAIEALLARGVPVDIPDPDGETALMKAIKANRPEAVKLLRRHGASISVKNKAGRSALDMAADKDDDALYEALGVAESR
jgi:ankyrin repeat protein